VALLDENGAATQALYNGIFQIGGGLLCVVFGPVLVMAWNQPGGWFLLVSGVGLTAWAIVELVRESKRP
jgi:hypothetical protein